MPISAEVVCDSFNTGEYLHRNARLTTFVLTFPRYLLAEFNTHRAFSRNAASSRAIPFKKMLDKVIKDTYIPEKWMKKHSGMQGTEYFDSETEENAVSEIKFAYNNAFNKTTMAAIYMNELNVSKQITNRLLEPFSYTKNIVTTTVSGFENFISQRFDSQADINFCKLAEKMLEAYNNSTPKCLKAGDWHVPFSDMDPSSSDYLNQVKISVAKCARVSYFDFDTPKTIEDDLNLHDNLIIKKHWSPFEHQAMAGYESQNSGNLNGPWLQYRKCFSSFECQRDERVRKWKYCPDTEILQRI